MSTWLKFDSGAKVDLILANLSLKPSVVAKNIKISYPKPKSEKSMYMDNILQWLMGNYFSMKCCSFILCDNVEFPFYLEVINGSDEFIYRFEQEETNIQENFGSTNNTPLQIGGLERQYIDIINIATTFFKSENFCNSQKIKMPRGILLYGPPGCGKTLLVKSVSDSINVPIVHLLASDFSSGGYGEAEAKLKKTFESAKNIGPCIIFMDEVDYLCPKRDAASRASSQRITTLLLTLMDGCSCEYSLSKIIFIGATNMISSLDSALRRPGRFDREIEISPPSSKERYAILKNILARYPNDVSDSDLKFISEISHGYVGSDLSLLCKESFMNSIKNENNISGAPKINSEDLKNAYSKIRPSAMREVFLEVPKVQWTDIGGQYLTKQKLIECVEWPIKFPDRFEKLGINPPKGILLFGPPGCSKTLLARALASESGLNFLAVKGPEIFSKYVGDSEKNIRDIFKKARQASPSIIFFVSISS